MTTIHRATISARAAQAGQPLNFVAAETELLTVATQTCQLKREIGVLYWLRQVGVLLILGLTIHLFPTLLATPETLSDFYTDLWPRSETLRREWRTERAGETVLPGKVQAMLALLREQLSLTRLVCW